MTAEASGFLPSDLSAESARPASVDIVNNINTCPAFEMQFTFALKLTVRVASRTCMNVIDERLYYASSRRTRISQS